MKFIHVSDVHLGIKPDEGKPWSEKRAQDIWDSFAEVIGAAVELKPDFLLISGDLFHAQPLKKELREVNYLFSRIPQTKIILMAGNHDYLRTKSYYLTMEWEENVYFFRQEEPGHFDFEEENVSIYGLSYWHREIGEPVYDSIIPEDLSKINILLVHGGDPQHIPYHPKHILENGFDYIAAGHIHKGGQQIPGRAVMAGSLEPTDKMMSDHMDTGWERSIKSIPIFIFIRSKNANTVMKFIRLQGKRQISNYVSGQKHCWQKDRGISISVCFCGGKFRRIPDLIRQS